MDNRPINQVILGGDPLFSSIDSIDAQLQNMEQYRQKLQQLKAMQSHISTKLVWDEIDAEILPLSDEQKQMLMQDSEYCETYIRINEMVQLELVNLVKNKIENTEEGKELLNKQLKTIKRLKSSIIKETNREMELFKKFKEYSKMNPSVTYEDFIKANM
jgi:predicted nuclease of predicted toxin-antitoxin system